MFCIQVKEVYKKFRIYHDKGLTLKERILFRNRNKFTEHQVLRGVSLDIESGQTVGLIGENGSGKSTLLKLLSGIIYPDQGDIKVKGKVSSLLELGAGFHPDFSGRENIYNNASVFGLSRKEIDSRFDEIVKFSELQEFIDNPVRTYSSGMYMRLAFSVAINVDADILLIDEILAVGDANFQKKCMDKIKELKSKGKTIVIVTHDMGSVEKICDKVVWLEEGVVRESGLARKIIDKYLLFMANKNNQVDTQNNLTKQSEGFSNCEKGNADSEDENRWGNKNIEITNVSMRGSDKKEKHLFLYGEKVEIEIEYKVNNMPKNTVFGIGIFTKDRKQCFGTNTFIDHFIISDLKPAGKVRMLIDELCLVEGGYSLDVAVHAEEGTPFDYHTDSYEFNVYSDIKDVGIYRPRHRWEIY